MVSDRVAISDSAASTGRSENRVRQQSFTWPTSGRWRVYLTYTLIIDILFFSVYGGANWFTAQRDTVLKIYWDWELSIPFIPEMIWVYLSMFALFFFPVFQLDEKQLARLGKQVLWGTVIAGLVFLILPGQLGFQRLGHEGVAGQVFGLIYTVDLPHNQAPSLHVVFSGLIIASLIEVSNRFLRTVYFSWLLFLLFSVVLVHQHHLFDVVSGLAVVGFCRWIIGSEMSAGVKG